MQNLDSWIALLDLLDQWKIDVSFEIQIYGRKSEEIEQD